MQKFLICTPPFKMFGKNDITLVANSQKRPSNFMTFRGMVAFRKSLLFLYVIIPGAITLMEFLWRAT